MTESVPVIDLGNMAIFDNASVKLGDPTDREKILLDASNASLRNLLTALFALPLPEGQLKSLSGSALVALPKSSTPLPRAKPVPKPRESTTWEQFARAKGIKKRNRQERYEYAEQKKKWLPRHGHLSEKRKDAKDATWCQELRPGQSMDLE